MNVDLTNEDIIALQETTEEDVLHNNNNKSKPDGQLKDVETNQHRIVFPAFDLSTKRFGFGNRSNRVTTIAYEVKCHPAHSTLLKSLLIKSSVVYPFPLYDTNIHFIPHGLIQSTDVTAVKNQIIQQNRFLAQTGIVPIFNIPEVTMKAGIKTRLLEIPSVIGLEPPYLTEYSGKWLVLVKKTQKYQTRRAIDTVIN